MIVEHLKKELLSAMDENDWPVTFSFGVAAFNRPPNTVNEAIKKADTLMYEVKNSTKNGIRSASF